LFKTQTKVKRNVLDGNNLFSDIVDKCNYKFYYYTH
jgi:hypothetical protein